MSTANDIGGPSKNKNDAQKGGAKNSKGQSQLMMNGGFSVVKIGKHHTSYVRKHMTGSDASSQDERTMFLVNLPVDTTEQHIRSLYALKAGTIESVRLWKGKGVEMALDEDQDDDERERKEKEREPKVVSLPPLDPRHPNPFLPTSTSAHVTFLDVSSLQRALAITRFTSWPTPSGVPVGLSYLLARHKSLRPPLEQVRTHVDSVIANFEWRLRHPAVNKRKAPAIEAVSVGPNGELLDADGFTIVQATGKYGRTTEGATQEPGSGGASVRVARKRSQASGAGRRRGGGGGDVDEAEDGQDGERQSKKKRLELDDFYRFQRREAKREELADLRAKFQADQEKIKQLKAKRNFKPF